MPKIVDVDQRRAELADAAARLIARSGIEAATMREVAAEAGLTTGALTHYFSDKRELLLTTFQASLAQRKSLRPADLGASAYDRLRASLHGALPTDSDRRRHWLVTIACSSHAVDDVVLAAAQRDAYNEFVAHVGGLAISSGFTAEDGAHDFAAMLIAAADGIAVQALFDPEGWPAHRQAATLDRMLAAFGVSQSG